MRTVIGLAVIALLVWLAWAPIRAALFGGRISYANSPKGEWVGELEITGGYKPLDPSDHLGPTRKAVVHCKLDVEDHFMDEYGGPGEIYIQGESKPRELHVTGLTLPERDQPLSVYLATHPVLFDQFQGTYSPNEMVISQNDNLFVRCHGTLHRGTTAEYNKLLQQVTTAPARP